MTLLGKNIFLKRYHGTVANLIDYKYNLCLTKLTKEKRNKINTEIHESIEVNIDTSIRSLGED
jgi:hypothetical protein